MYLYKEARCEKWHFAHILLSSLVLLFLAGCQSDEPFSPVQKFEGELSVGKSGLPTESDSNNTLLRELALARSATAPYHNLNKAKAAGYENINLFIPGMGDHYVNFALVDGTFEIDKPEALVYHPMGNGNKQKLVSLEYLVATPGPPASPPEGFTGDLDDWHWDEDFQVWTLHAWVWMHNKDGMFAELNPALLP